MSLDLIIVAVVLVGAVVYWCIKNRGRSPALRTFIAEIGPEGVNLDGKSVLYAGCDLIGIDHFHGQIVIYLDFSTYDKLLMSEKLAVIPYEEIMGFSFIFDEIDYVPSLHQNMACSHCSRVSDRGEDEVKERVIKGIDMQVITIYDMIIRISLVKNELHAVNLQSQILDWESFMLDILKYNALISILPDKGTACLPG